MIGKTTASSGHFQKVFNGGFPIIFLTTNQEGNITFISDSWENFTGFSVASCISASLFDYIKFSPTNHEIFNDLDLQNKEELFQGYATLQTNKGDNLQVEVHLSSDNAEIEVLVYVLSQIKEIEVEGDYSQLLDTLVEGISAQTGRQLFESFVLNLTKLIEADYVFVGEYTVENHAIHTLALCENDKIIENFEYSLEYTPCKDVMDANICVLSENVINLFPKDQLLKDMAIEGYIGVPLQSEGGLTIGIMVALFKKPIKNSDYLTNILKIFSGRASAELERIQIDKKLKEKENALLNERSFLRRLIDNIPDLIFIKNLEGKFLLCNSAFESMLGKKEIALKGLTDYDLYTDEIARQFRSKDQEVITNNKIIRSEEWGYAANGKKVRLDTLKLPYHNLEGNIKGVIGISRDISDLIETRITLKNSEQLYKSAVTVLNEGVIVHNSAGKIISCNNAAEQILGLTYDQMKGLTSLATRWKCVHEDYTPFVDTAHPVMLVLQNLVPVRGIIMGVHKPEGNLVWLTINAEPVFDAKTKALTSVIASFSDITRFKLVQEALKESEFQYRSLFEMATDAILLTSAEEIVASNPRAAQILQKAHNESLLGKQLSDISSPNNSPQAVKMLEDFLENAVAQDELKLEWEFLSNDGCGLITELTISHIEINCKEHFMLFIHDISERKRNEEAIKNQNVQLKKANQELDSFVYRVSHDLRSPIASVLGLIQLMQDEQDPLKRQEYLGMQEQKMQRLDSFISDILDYSRNARMFISEDIIDFDAFFKQCLEMNRFSSDAKDVNISIEVNQKVPFVSDKARLLVIFNNLISNSIRYQKLYNDDKKLNIKVNVTASDLSVEILDNGIGIMEEHIKKIFDMFYRATSQKPGSGLGLYIVKDAVEKLGGIIAVASKYGEGTRFTFSIPNKKSST